MTNHPVSENDNEMREWVRRVFASDPTDESEPDPNEPAERAFARQLFHPAD